LEAVVFGMSGPAISADAEGRSALENITLAASG
jgi:hypothetical protein